MVDFSEKWTDHVDAYKSMGVTLPKNEVATPVENPVWMHFGGGNLYRGLHAEIAQNLIDSGDMTDGVIIVEGFDEGVIPGVYDAYNNDILQVVLKEDGSTDYRLINATGDAVNIATHEESEWEKLVKYFVKPSLQFITMTITEKGYAVTDGNGNLTGIAQKDVENGPVNPTHSVSIVAGLLYARWKENQAPIALVSTDNFSRNGLVLQENVNAIIDAWAEADKVEAEFVDYAKDETKVSYPWSMVDRITPNPADSIVDKLNDLGIENVDVVHTDKGTNVAAFVNTEEVFYMVIEDNFPNGRPDLEAAGVLLGDRETVEKADEMKVTTSLNPLHTAMAIYGSILEIPSISAAISDPQIKALVEEVGYTEGLPVVEDPEIIDPKEFIDEVVNVRFPNPNIPDTPQRIATDTSQKIPVRFGETIKKYTAADDKDPAELTYIPLVLAGWFRYLMAKNDEGQDIEISNDPMFPELKDRFAGVQLNDEPVDEAIVRDLLENDKIFGVNLYEIGLADKVIGYFNELKAGPGAVRATLEKYLD